MSFPLIDMIPVSTRPLLSGVIRREPPCVLWGWKERRTPGAYRWDPWHTGVKRLSLVPAALVPPSCTDRFVVAYVLLDTVRNYLEMVLFCEVNNTL